MSEISKSDLEGIKGVTELALEIARLKGELDAVTQERDYLRSVVASHRPIVVHQPADGGNGPYFPWMTYTVDPGTGALVGTPQA